MDYAGIVIVLGCCGPDTGSFASQSQFDKVPETGKSETAECCDCCTHIHEAERGPMCREGSQWKTGQPMIGSEKPAVRHVSLNFIVIVLGHCKRAIKVK